MKHTLPKLPLAPLCAGILCATLTSAGFAQQPVFAGLDFLETDAGQTFEDLSSLDLLCPGCQIVGSPVIPLRGIPIPDAPTCPGADLGNTDTIIRRPVDTPILFPMDPPVQIPIQIEQLHLQSIQPFQVDCGGGIENWMLDVTVDPAIQPQGQMTITKSVGNGGFFDSSLPVVPHLIFTRVDVCPPVTMCELDGPVINFTTFGAPWAETPTHPILEIPGCTSNFLAGADPGPIPLAGPSPGFVYMDAAIPFDWGLHATNLPKIFQNTWQDAVHFTFDVVNQGATGGPIDALRLFNVHWIPPDSGAVADSSVYFKSNSICNTDSLWTPAPTSWTRVNWDSTSALFREEAYWFFPPTLPGLTAPEMDVVFSLPDTTGCVLPSTGAWYEVNYECFSACVVVDAGVFRFHCDPLPGTGAVSAPVLDTRLRVGALEQNFPNPFRPSTTIRFSLERRENVRLSIFDVRGALVRDLVRGMEDAGDHDVSWDGRDANGNRVAAGVYFYELQAGGVREARKMVHLK